VSGPMRSGGSARDGGVHTAKAVLVIVVVVLVGWWVLYKSHGSAKPSAAAATATPSTTAHASHGSTTTVPRATTTVALVPPASIKLQVLNGVLTGALAGQWTAKLKANPGYSVLPPDDATAKVASSVIYVITPGYGPEGNALASTVGLTPAAVQTVVPATAPIPAAEKAKANLVLIIGPDLEASA
jgi:LytR cell envelope-related transcriptional attenuator